METVIDLRILDPRFQSGLIFSFFEGLIQGKDFRIIFDHDPKEIKNHFQELKINNAELSVQQTTQKTWEMRILKSEKNLATNKQSCCGVCGE